VDIDLLKKLFLFSTYVLGSFVKNQMAMAVWIYLWVFYYVPLAFMQFLSVLCHSGCYCSIVYFKGRYCDNTNIALFAQDLTIQGLFCFHMNFGAEFSISLKKVIGILMGFALNM
jgi:hypothetical protein